MRIVEQKHNSINFKKIQLQKVEQEKAAKLLESLHTAKSSEISQKIKYELFNIFDKHLQNEANKFLNNIFINRDDFLQTLYLKFFEYIQKHGEVTIITDNKTINFPQNCVNKNSNYSIFNIKIPSISKKNYDDFVTWYKNLLEKKDNFVISSILPLFSWYIKKNNDKCDIFHIMKLAYSLTVRYTEPYGK